MSKSKSHKGRAQTRIIMTGWILGSNSISQCFQWGFVTLKDLCDNLNSEGNHSIEWQLEALLSLIGFNDVESFYIIDLVCTIHCFTLHGHA